MLLTRSSKQHFGSLRKRLTRKMNADAVEAFALKMQAFETLTDLHLKSAYDEVYEAEKQRQLELLKDTACIETDCAQRHRLLSLFYAKRRQTMEAPGISNMNLEELGNVPSNVLKFHIWYFREKGWVSREESGLIAITAAGVDKIESYVEVQLVDPNGHSTRHADFRKPAAQMDEAGTAN